VIPAGPRAAALQLQVFCSPARPIPGGTFSPITSALLMGPTEVAVVDAQFHRADVRALGDLIAASGRTLTTILVTHGHGDHCFGSGHLLARFPGARFVATPAVAAYLRTHLDRETAMARTLLGEDAVLPTQLPDAMDTDVVTVDGIDMRVLDVGQGDIAPSAILHAPTLGAVCAGDIAYNGIHQMLGLGSPAEWDRWLASLTTIEALRPTVVVAGHKQPGADDDATRVLSQTRTYIRHFAAAYARADTAEDLVAEMLDAYPAHGNVTTLQFSAAQALRRRQRSPHG